MTGNERALAKRLESIGWGLLLIWVGAAFLMGVGWGVAIVGVGAIALGSQAARKYYGLPVERFGLAFGIVLVILGLWEVLKIDAVLPGGMLPLLLIGAGTFLVVSALVRKPRGH